MAARVSLNSAYQDLLDRYGEDDPAVLELKSELERRETVAVDPAFVDRRRNGRASVRDRKSSGLRPPLREMAIRAFTKPMERHELLEPIHIGAFAGSLLHRSDWDHP